jgi:hypothetical protein
MCGSLAGYRYGYPNELSYEPSIKLKVGCNGKYAGVCISEVTAKRKLTRRHELILVPRERRGRGWLPSSWDYGMRKDKW